MFTKQHVLYEILTKKEHRQVHFSDVEELHGNVSGIKFWLSVRKEYALNRNIL
jgi:predicted phosphatase